MNLNRQLLGCSLMLTLLLFGFAACNRGDRVEAAREPDAKEVSSAEQDFMMKALQANTTEVQVARIAREKSANGDVKDYAHMIESDHNRALQDLVDIMKDKNVPESKNLAPQVRQDMDRLNSLSGAEFDREFINMMVSEHEKAVGLFRDEADVVTNRDLANYVNDKLSRLDMHLQNALALQSKLFGGGK